MIENLVCNLMIGLLVGISSIIIWAIFTLIKNEFTYRNHCIIVDAIVEYHIHLIDEGCFDQIKRISFADMEDYNTTLNRFWDWGYTRILPPEKFELVKPFIKQRRRKAVRSNGKNT